MRYFVVDTETTGLGKNPNDKVVDIGIVALDTDTGSVEDVYSSVIGYDVESWDEQHRNAWIFSHSDLTLDDVRNAPPFSRVRDDVKSILVGKTVTSYNTVFDFRFLLRDEWMLRGWFRLAPCIMEAATPVVGIRLGDDAYGWYKWPKLEEAYACLCPSDPVGIADGQDHRALSDARAAAYVLKAMMESGNYAYAVEEESTRRCEDVYVEADLTGVNANLCAKHTFAVPVEIAKLGSNQIKEYIKQSIEGEPDIEWRVAGDPERIRIDCVEVDW